MSSSLTSQNAELISEAPVISTTYRPFLSLYILRTY